MIACIKAFFTHEPQFAGTGPGGNMAGNMGVWIFARGFMPRNMVNSPLFRAWKHIFLRATNSIRQLKKWVSGFLLAWKFSP
jgi:hypothetical protein